MCVLLYNNFTFAKKNPVSSWQIYCLKSGKGRWRQLCSLGLVPNSVQVSLSLSWRFLFFSAIPSAHTLILEKPVWALARISLQAFRTTPLDISVLSQFSKASPDPSCSCQVPPQFPEPECVLQEALGVICCWWAALLELQLHGTPSWGRWPVLAGVFVLPECQDFSPLPRISPWKTTLQESPNDTCRMHWIIPRV